MGMELMNRYLNESDSLVCLLGREVAAQSGCDMYRSDFYYDVEQKYGHSLEEIFSLRFYKNRPREFFEFYRNEILMKRGTPNEIHEMLRRLEEAGKLKNIITRGIFGLTKSAGIQNTIQVHGSIYENHCPKCRKEFPISYMMKEPVPYCDVCGAVVEPSAVFQGDLVDNMKITRAARFVGQADTILILGSNMHSSLVKGFLKYYKGNRVILLSEEHHYDDEKADCIVHGNLREIAKKICL